MSTKFAVASAARRGSKNQGQRPGPGGQIRGWNMTEAGALYREDRRLAYLSLAPSMVILFCLSVVPTITVLRISLQDVETGSMSGPFIGLDNYAWALDSYDFFNALKNSLVWTFGSVALEMTVGLGIALIMHRQFRFRGLARAAVLTPYLVPTVVAVLAWRFMFHDILGVLNYALISIGLVSGPVLWLQSPDYAMLSVIIVGVWKFFPFVVIALLGILQAIPQDQYEAARLDGASAFQQFYLITLPHIMPVFLLSALLRTIWSFHKFDIIYLLTGGGPLNATTTLPVLVYLKGFVDFELGRAAAIAVLAMLMLSLVLVAYLVLVRRSEAHL
jgi:multiple sugar transport system permease protein